MYLGLDISTSIVGYCVLNSETKKREKIGYIDLTKETDIYAKADKVMIELEDKVFNKYKLKEIIIEDAMGNFAIGKSKMQVIILLASFNGMVSYNIHKYNIPMKHINVRTGRCNIGFHEKRNLFDNNGKKLDAKHQITNYCLAVDKTLSDIVEYTSKNNIQPYVFDQIDAFVMAMNGGVQ